MGSESKTHNWNPKIFWWLFNIGTLNTHTLYLVLCAEHTPERVPLDMGDADEEAMHAFCQRGKPM